MAKGKGGFYEGKTEKGEARPPLFFSTPVLLIGVSEYFPLCPS